MQLLHRTPVGLAWSVGILSAALHAQPSRRCSLPTVQCSELPRRAAAAATNTEQASPADDPIYKDELWLNGEMVRYGSSINGAGVGYCVSFEPMHAAVNHTRAVVMLSTAPVDEEALHSLAGRVALSCECVTLVPVLRGGMSRWTHERLSEEAWSAATYLNAARGAEALAFCVIGPTTPLVLSLLAQGALNAHAVIALSPTGDERGSGQAARELDVPLLCVVSAGADDNSLRHVAGLRHELSLNTRLGSDYYVAEFSGCTADFVLTPQHAADVKAAERALALVHSWIDGHLPESLGEAPKATAQ